MQLQVNINQDKALLALRKFPQALGAALRPAVKAGLRDIQVDATQDHVYTSRSGNTDRSIKVEIAPNNLGGKVFLDTGIAPYGPILHEGSGLYGPKGQAFTVEAKNKKALRWVFGGGFRYAKKVVIKGIKPDPFLYRSARHNLAAMMARFNAAVDRTLAAGGLK